MKRIIIGIFLLAPMAAMAQSNTEMHRDTLQNLAPPPVSNANPNQLTNYNQNNSSYNNNATQSNKPPDPNASRFQGNGTYVDPSRSPAGQPQNPGNNGNTPPVSPH